MSEKQRYFCAAGAAILLLIADQLTKHLAVRALADGTVIRIIPGVLELTLVYNTGAAFGLGQGGQLLFTGLAFLISAGILIWLYRAVNGAGGLLRQAALVLILSGALGNALDRIRWRYVIDFIYIRLIDFPVFNIADICVTVGCALLFLDMFLWDRTGHGEHG